MNRYEFILFAKKPLAFYSGFISVFLIIFFLFIKEWGIQDVLLFILVFVFAYYYFFLRYACEVYVNDNSIRVHYIAPWIPDISITKNSIDSIDYIVSFWDMESSYKKSRNFKNVCYDTLILSKTDGNIEEININTRYFYFHKLLNHLGMHER